jgi:hypothetical protein
MLIAGAKYSVLVGWPPLIALVVFGQSLLVTWVGPEYASASKLLVILAVPTFLSLPQSTASSVLYGISRHPGAVALSLINALLNLGLSLAVNRTVDGRALGTAVPLVLRGGVAPRPTLAVLRLDPRYAREGLRAARSRNAGVRDSGDRGPDALASDRVVRTWRRCRRELARVRHGRLALGTVGRRARTLGAHGAAPLRLGGRAVARRGRRKMTQPRISVVLTCYNAAWCVERALDSVFAQTRPADEIVVTDDGSTDDTVERITSRYEDRVRVLRLPHQGLTPSRRAAIEAAEGNWVALLDADDEWLPEKLATQVRFLERHPETRWITTDGLFVSDQGVLRESWLPTTSSRSRSSSAICSRHSLTAVSRSSARR